MLGLSANGTSPPVQTYPTIFCTSSGSIHTLRIKVKRNMTVSGRKEHRNCFGRKYHPANVVSQHIERNSRSRICGDDPGSGKGQSAVHGKAHRGARHHTHPSTTQNELVHHITQRWLIYRCCNGFLCSKATERLCEGIQAKT